MPREDHFQDMTVAGNISLSATSKILPAFTPDRIGEVRIVGGQGTLPTIQDAIDDVTSGASPGVVYIPAGKYQISSTLNIDESNLTIIGAGRNNTIIECTDATIDCIKVTGNKVCMRGLELRYSVAANAGTYALRITNSNEGVYEDIYIVDSDIRNGVLLEQTTTSTTETGENHFHRVEVLNCTNDGFTVSGFSGTQRVIGTHLSDVRVAACTTSGLVVNDWVQGVFADNTSRFESCGRNVFINPTVTGRTFDFLFDHTIFDAATVNENLWADNVDRLFVDNSWFSTTPTGKFNIVIGSGVSAGSRIKGSFVSFGKGGEISVAGDNVYLTNNTHHSSSPAPTDAINITSDSSGVHIAGSEFRGGYTKDINDNGTSTVIGPYSTDDNAESVKFGSPILSASLTTTQRDALTGQNGMIIYNTTDNQMQGYINGSWTAM